MAQLVEALRYKPKGRGFDSRWCHWNFSLIQSFWPHCGPGVDPASDRNEYQEYFLGSKGGRCERLTTLPPSCVDCLEIWGASTSWNPQGLSRPVMGIALHFISIKKNPVLFYLLILNFAFIGKISVNSADHETKKT